MKDKADLMSLAIPTKGNASYFNKRNLIKYENLASISFMGHVLRIKDISHRWESNFTNTFASLASNALAAIESYLTNAEFTVFFFF